MTLDDIEGATHAIDDGTHWIFAHCSPDEHIAFAATAKAFAIQQFALIIASAQIKTVEATNDVAKQSAIVKAKALISFAEAVGESVHKAVIDASLGHFHKNRNDDHNRDLTAAAIQTVLTDWGHIDSPNRSNRTHVASSARAISAELTKAHTVEYRHVKAARLEAAKKAAQSAAQDTNGD